MQQSQSYTLDSFLKLNFPNDENFMKIKAICQKNFIDDLETLFEFSSEELAKIQFPTGAIKKIQPFLMQLPQNPNQYQSQSQQQQSQQNLIQISFEQNLEIQNRLDEQIEVMEQKIRQRKIKIEDLNEQINQEFQQIKLNEIELKQLYQQKSLYLQQYQQNQMGAKQDNNNDQIQQIQKDIANKLNIHSFSFDNKTILPFAMKLSNLNSTVSISEGYGSCVLGDKNFSSGRVYWEVGIDENKGLLLPFGVAGADYKYRIGHYFSQNKGSICINYQGQVSGVVQSNPTKNIQFEKGDQVGIYLNLENASQNTISIYHNGAKIHYLKIPSGIYTPAFDISSGQKITLNVPKKFPDFL